MTTQMIFDAKKMNYLTDLTKSVIEASRIKPNESLLDMPGGEELAKMNYGIPYTNETGVTLIRPGGWTCYPSFWIRDFAMSLQSNIITSEELKGMIRLTAKSQNGHSERVLNTACIPPFAIPDHIKFDGKPVFYPGTNSSGDDQGGEHFGYYPPYCDYFYFVEMVYRYILRSSDTSFLKEPIDGLTILERLARAFEVPDSDPQTGILITSLERRAINFGFMDTIVQTGHLFFSSILKYRAAHMLAWLLERQKDYSQRAIAIRNIAWKIQQSIPSIFGSNSGWMLSSTGLSNQPDVWGTVYAIYTGLLTGKERISALEVMRDAYLSGDTCYRGNVRHVPKSLEASSEAVWNKTVHGFDEKNRYQNGAYWGTPVGWYVYALNQIDPQCAKKMFTEYVDELMEGDFRLNRGMGAPWECFHTEGEYRQNGVYMTSVTVPYGVFLEMAQRVS